MDLGAIETALEAWAETLTGLSLRWRHQSQIAMRFPHLEAELLAIRGKGHDEQVWTYASGTDNNSLAMTGVRAMTFTFHFRSRSQNLGESARQYAETFRTRLLRPSSIDTLVAANLALVEVLSLTATDYEDRNGRSISQVSVDLLFEHRSTESDSTFDGEYIKQVTVGVDSLAIDEFGAPLVDENGDFVTVDTGDTLSIPGT